MAVPLLVPPAPASSFVLAAGAAGRERAVVERLWPGGEGDGMASVAAEMGGKGPMFFRLSPAAA